MVVLLTIMTKILPPLLPLPHSKFQHKFQINIIMKHANIQSKGLVHRINQNFNKQLKYSIAR